MSNRVNACAHELLRCTQRVARRTVGPERLGLVLGRRFFDARAGRATRVIGCGRVARNDIHQENQDATHFVLPFVIGVSCARERGSVALCSRAGWIGAGGVEAATGAAGRALSREVSNSRTSGMRFSRNSRRQTATTHQSDGCRPCDSTQSHSAASRDLNARDIRKRSGPLYRQCHTLQPGPPLWIYSIFPVISCVV